MARSRWSGAGWFRWLGDGDVHTPRLHLEASVEHRVGAGALLCEALDLLKYSNPSGRLIHSLAHEIERAGRRHQRKQAKRQIVHYWRLSFNWRRHTAWAHLTHRKDDGGGGVASLSSLGLRGVEKKIVSAHFCDLVLVLERKTILNV